MPRISIMSFHLNNSTTCSGSLLQLLLTRYRCILSIAVVRCHKLPDGGGMKRAIERMTHTPLTDVSNRKSLERKCRCDMEQLWPRVLRVSSP